MLRCEHYLWAEMLLIDMLTILKVQGKFTGMFVPIWGSYIPVKAGQVSKGKDTDH
jgi:hypothetical protein